MTVVDRSASGREVGVGGADTQSLLALVAQPVGSRILA